MPDSDSDAERQTERSDSIAIADANPDAVPHTGAGSTQSGSPARAVHSAGDADANPDRIAGAAALGQPDAVAGAIGRAACDALGRTLGNAVSGSVGDPLAGSDADAASALTGQRRNKKALRFRGAFLFRR